jgi:thermitase
MGRLRSNGTGWIVRSLVVCWLIAIAWLGAPMRPAAGRLPQTPLPGSGSHFVPGEILIKLRGGTAQPQAAARALAAPELAMAEAVPDLGLLKLNVAVGSELSRAQEFRARPGVEFAEPDYIVHALEVPNDPDFSLQWGLSMINAPAAWDVTHGSSAVIIAIVDSGIDGRHPDLSSKMLAGWNFISSASIPADSN